MVHPAPGHWDDTLVNALVARGTELAGGAEGRPGIVHRLDRDTSGLMVVAKTDLAHRRLGAAIAARRVRRTYAALAWGHLDQSPTVIEAPLARHPRDRKRMAVRRRVGRRGPTPLSWPASRRWISCGWSSTPAGPIRSGSISSMSGTRWWVTRSTPVAEVAGSPARRAGRRRRWSARHPARRFTRPLWHSAIP